MPSSTSSLGRFSSYSLYSSYPSYPPYRTTPSSASSSSYYTRTTSLDRSYSGGPGTATGSYYRYSGGSKGGSNLPPRPSYSSITDSYRSSRSVRTSPGRSLGRLSSDSSVDRESSASRYLTLSRPPRGDYYSHGYGSRGSIDYSNGDTSRRRSLYRRESSEDDSLRMRVLEGWRDPAEDRLAERRRRLGLSPSRDTSGSRSPRVPLGARDDNRKGAYDEENGNASPGGHRPSVSDLCRLYNSNLNISNGETLSGCSGGSGPSIAPKDPAVGSVPDGVTERVVRSRHDSLRDEKDSPKLSRRVSPSAKNTDTPKTTSLRSTDVDPQKSTSTHPFRSKDRRERMKERIAARLATEVEDGESPPSRRRSPTGSSSDSLGDTNGLVGLRNIGNTCFMNSITQCLSNTRCLLEYMLRENYVSDINVTLSTMKGELVRAFGLLLNEMWRDGASGPINTCAFKSQIQGFAPAFIGYAQHDAQEFLRKLLEGLHEDVNRVTVRPRPIAEDIDESLDDHQKAMEAWKRYLRYDDSKIVDMFVGQLKSSLQCSVCSHRSVTFDPFWDLSLPIPSRAGQVKLSQCLDLFTKEEVLDGDERPTCSKCRERRKMTKSFSIQKFPKVLVLHLKRFSPHERWRGKLTCMVEFPLDSLHLSRYAASSSISSQYRLISVANHSGTALSGHYTAYCSHPYLKTWREYNDSRVSPISSNRVCSAEAYVLFYELSSY